MSRPGLARATVAGWLRRRLAPIALVAAAVTLGAWIRWWPPSGPTAWVSGVSWPWSPTIVTVYHAAGPYLVPVSRRVPSAENLPRAALQMLLDGPVRGGGLLRAVPAGVSLRSLDAANGIATIGLSGDLFGHLDRSPIAVDTATTAIVQTLTALPGIDAVTISVDGRPVVALAGRTPLLYFAGVVGLTAVKTAASTPRAAVEAYMAGPPPAASPEHTLTGLPRDVRLLSYGFEDSVVSLGLQYSPSVRTLALERPDTMRTVLLGLIASLTEHAGVRAVTIDFEGHSQLGLGECSDLLRTPQPRPRLLNDERLVGR